MACFQCVLRLRTFQSLSTDYLGVSKRVSSLMHVDNRVANFITKPTQIVNFIRNKFPKQQRWKEYPRENHMKVQEAWENFALTRLGVNFEHVTQSCIRPAGGYTWLCKHEQPEMNLYLFPLLRRLTNVRIRLRSRGFHLILSRGTQRIQQKAFLIAFIAL